VLSEGPGDGEARWAGRGGGGSQAEKNHPGINELERGMNERQRPEVAPEVVPEVVPERMPEVVQERMPEVVPEVDVEMTLK